MSPLRISILVLTFAIPVLPVSALAQSNGKATGNPFAAMDARIVELEAKVAALQSAGDHTIDPAQLAGTWVGSRFVGKFGTPAEIVEEPNQSFTFDANGNFNSPNFFRASAEYLIMRNTILLGPLPLQDVRIDDATLTFYMSNRTGNVGQGFTVGQGAVYVLHRQP